MTQLALPIGLADHAVFASFHPAGNAHVVAHLEVVARGEARGGAWLRGSPGSGKSHLLQAACAAAGDRAVYLPGRLLATTDTALLDGLETRDVVLLDDAQALAGNAAWEQALFALYNRLLAHGRQLVAAAPAAPRDSGFVLADLASRFGQLPIFRVQALAEAERPAALQLRAAQRGLDLTADVAAYLLTHSPRDMSSLQALLEVLDREALQAQRKLTVPFVRDVLARYR